MNHDCLHIELELLCLRGDVAKSMLTGSPEAFEI